MSAPTPHPAPAVDPFSPVQIGPLTLRNRIVKAATFEGVMPKGVVSDELVAFHAAVARGGAALTTVAYCAVSPGGRVHRNTLVLRPEIVGDLRRLTDAVHDEGALVAAQIGHAGLVANVKSNRAPTMAPSTRFSPPAMGIVRGITTRQIDDVVDEFARAATVAVEAGFDAVEVHLGHNYLLSSFMSPNLNKRKDDYGGSIEHRSRLPRRVVAAVRDAVGPDVAVTAKFNMIDGPKRGLQPDESLEIAALLEADGHLDAMELTGGSSLLDSMFFFRGPVPRKEFAATQPAVVRAGLRVIGPRIFKEYPYEEAFLLPHARRFRARLSLPLVLLGGISRLDTVHAGLAEGFEAVAMARALLCDPDLPNRMRDEHVAAGRCTHCNGCLPTIYTGTHCVLPTPAP